MKFKAGDKVLVRDDLIVGREYGNNVFANSMLPTLGKYITVLSINKFGSYNIEENMFNYTEEMLQPFLEESNAVFFNTEDVVNNPSHYKVGGVETIDFIEAKKLSYHLGNAVKYLSRAEYKGNKEQDLKKAIWYIQRELEKGVSK